MVSSFEELNVYQSAYQIALDIHKATLSFPKIEQFALGDQMRRASKAICANIAEGFGKQHKSAPEFKRFIVMAMGSTQEMVVWMNFAVDLGYIEKDTAKDWKNSYTVIARQLNSLHTNWRS